MIATLDEAYAAGKGVATFEGRMIEELHAAAARRVLAVKEAISNRQ